jgi:hypothetical protein
METKHQDTVEEVYLHRNPRQFIYLTDQIYQAFIAIHKAMALPRGFSTMLSNSIGICLILLGLVVMPTTELVLIFDIHDSGFSWHIKKYS